MASDLSAKGWEPQPLPRGRHKLPRETVLASQRARLLRAMLESVAQEGYEATTVPKVVARARVSRNAFYELFADKTDCFIALCDDYALELIDVLQAYGDAEDWISALAGGVERYFLWWQERPAFTRTYFLELPTAGVRAITQRERSYARFRTIFEALGQRARIEQPELPPLREVAVRSAIWIPTELITEEVRAGREHRLVELSADATFLLVKLLADDETAQRAAR